MELKALQTTNESWRRIESTTNLLDDPSVRGIVANVDDGAERRPTEDARRLLATIVDAADDAILSRTLDGVVLSWNAGAERLYGYRAADIVGRSIRLLVPPDQAEELPGIDERLRRGERVETFDTVRVRRDGARIDVSITVSPITDAAGSIVAAVAIARDITERKRTQEALERAHAELRQAHDELERRVAERTAELAAVNAALGVHLAERQRAEAAVRQQAAAFREQAQLLELAHDAIFVCDFECGLIRYWNAAAEALYGWTRDQALGQPIAALSTTELPPPAATHDELLRSGRWEGELEHRTRDGRTVVVESRWALQRDDGGRPWAVLHINRDVTERKRIERERAALRAAEQEQTRREAELTALKDDFTAIVAHELASPISAIRNLAEMLATGALRPEQQANVTAMIQAETELLFALVADVRGIATVERDAFAIEPRPVTVDELLMAAATFNQTQPGQHPLLTVIAANERVRADPERIAQVLHNLIGNAAKYSADGSPIELRAWRQDDRVRIEVADRGPGIHPDDLGQIFEKFRRGRDASGRRVPGTGLGLYVCQRIVRAHGGELTVQSRPGHGATFGFDLDVVR